MTSLLEITKECVDADNESLSSARTKTTKYREAFESLASGEKSLTCIAKEMRVTRKHLRQHYEKFIQSGKSFSEYRFKKLKKGRKTILSFSQISSIRIAAYTLDNIGHPTSKPSLNSIIRQIAGISHKRKSMSYSSLLRYRRKISIPKRTVRNGPSVRGEKSKAEYIFDFHMKYEEVINKFRIPKHMMFVFHYFLSFTSY
jgi:hypothetical protein